MGGIVTGLPRGSCPALCLWDAASICWEPRPPWGLFGSVEKSQPSVRGALVIPKLARKEVPGMRDPLVRTLAVWMGFGHPFW